MGHLLVYVMMLTIIIGERVITDEGVGTAMSLIGVLAMIGMLACFINAPSTKVKHIGRK